MKYFLISDIHGSLPALQKALVICEREGCDMICIIGDILNYGPRNGVPEGLDAQGIVKELNALADRIVAVRGNCDSEVDQMLLKFPIMADYTLIVDNGRKLLLTHGHLPLPPGHFDAVITGHTHLWKLRREEGKVVCNTGSVTFPKNGNVPTVGTYADGCFRIFDLDGRQLEELVL